MKIRGIDHQNKDITQHFFRNTQVLKKDQMKNGLLMQNISLLYIISNKVGCSVFCMIFTFMLMLGIFFG